MAGINDIFKGHSSRAASTSKAFKSGVGITDILKTAHWKNANNFYKHYQKQICVKETNADHQRRFAEAVLTKN